MKNVTGVEGMKSGSIPEPSSGGEGTAAPTPRALGHTESAHAESQLALIPAPILAAALAKACGQLASTKPELAERILKNLWVDIVPVLMPHMLENRTGRFAAAVLTLESYFTHSGNWAHMEHRLASAARCYGIPPVLTDALVKRLSETLTTAAPSQTDEERP